MKKYSSYALVIFFLALALSSCTKRKPEEPDYAPNSPFNPYPPDSATNIDHTTLDVTLRWTATDPDGNAMTCDIYLDTLNPPDTLIVSGLSSSSYFLTGLSYNTTYYWKLYLTDDKGVTTSGPVWQFTTLPHANTAPNLPTYLYPADNAPWEYPTLTLRWTGTDPEGSSDTLHYDMYLGKTPQVSPTPYENDTASSHEFTGLDYTTTYYWKVVVHDNHYAYNTGPVHSFTTRECPWFYKSNMPSPRSGFGTAVVNNKIYIVGGTNGIYSLSEVLEYNPAMDIWTRMADMPTPRSQAAVAVWNGRIYALGGKTTNGLYTDISNKNEVYEPAINHWSSASPLPRTDENITSAHAINGKIYTVGPVMEYDIAADAWWDTVLFHLDTVWTDTSCTIIDTIVLGFVTDYIKSALPHDRLCHCSAAYNNLIYVMGGTTFYVDVYHPETNHWYSARDMIGPAIYPAATVANDFIYVVGGDDGSYSKKVRKYDPSLNAWFIRSDLQTGRFFFGVASVGSNIYAIGGVLGLAQLSTVEEYRIELDPKNR